MAQTNLGLIFTLEVDGKPTAAFKAKNLREASELCREDWLRADLSALQSKGVPLCTPTSKLKARSSHPEEIHLYQRSEHIVQASENLIFAYLVSLDGLGPAGNDSEYP